MTSMLRSTFFGASALAILSGAAHGATPAAGTLDPAGAVTWGGGPYNAPTNVLGNQTGTGGTATLQCVPGALDCDDFALTVTVPAGYAAEHPDAKVRLVMTAPTTGDYDVYVLDASGNEVAQGASAAAAESLSFPLVEGTNTYTVRTVPFSSSPAYATVASIDPGPTYGGCAGCDYSATGIPSKPAEPRVVVAVVDSAINPYHEFYYNCPAKDASCPSQVTQEILRDLGVKPENVVALSRTESTVAANVAKDAAFWDRAQKGELYHFKGTNIVAASFAGPNRPALKPEPSTLKNQHGTGTSSAVLVANREAVLLFIETQDDLGNDDAQELALRNPAVDIMSTSYGIAVQGLIGVIPETRFSHDTWEGVIRRGKLHFTSAGNNPGPTPLTGGAGPWWSIGVSGNEDNEDDALLGDSGQGQQIMSGNGADMVADYSQQLPYCADCMSGIQDNVPGTSFSTPRSAGVASKVILEARRALGHVGGITLVDGKPVMAAGGGRAISNWWVRRALEQAAYVPPVTDYSPQGYVTWEVTTLPINPAAPWLQVGWGEITHKPEKGVVSGALAHLGFPGTPVAKAPGFCEYQTQLILARKAYWDTIAPQIPTNISANAGTAGTLDEDPFIYCDSPNPLQPATNDPGSDADGDGVRREVDNCPDTANADQADTDGDGTGDACEAEGGAGGPLPDQCDPTGTLPQGANCLSNVPVAGPLLFGEGGEPTDPGIENASCEAGTNLGGGRSYHVTLTAPDGEVNSFQVLEPASFDCANRASGAHPLLLQGHGYGGSRSTSGYDSYRAAGYAVISIDQRGFGASSGTVRVMDPDHEGRSLLQILDWAEANLDYLSWRDESTGAFIARPAGKASVANGPNLVVGSMGGSYGGGYQLLLLAVDAQKRLDAVQPDITWHDLRNSLNPGDTIKAQYDTLLFAAGEATSHAAGLQNNQAPNGQDPFIKEAFARGGTTGEFPRQALDWFRYHSLSHWCGASGLPTMPYVPYGSELAPMATGPDNTPAPQPDGKPGIGSLNVPANPLTHFQGLSVLLTQGMADTLFNFNEAWWNAQCLSAAGADVKLYTHNGGHGLVVATPGDTTADFAGNERCGGIDAQGWFDSKLKPAGGSDERSEVCFVIKSGDSVYLRSDHVLAPQPNTGLAGGHDFVERDVNAQQVPNGIAAVGSAMGAQPVEVSLGFALRDGIVAGVPHLTVTVSSVTGLNEAAQDCAPATVPTVRLGCDSVTLVGLGVRRAGSTEAAQLIDDQLRPLRGLGTHDVDLVGIAERIALNDELVLLLYGTHAQYYSSISRDVTLPAVNVVGRVRLPIYGSNADGSPNFSNNQLVLSGGTVSDLDGDGVADEQDNCDFVPNEDQADFDGDQNGDACDPDDDGDGVGDEFDAFPYDGSEWADADGDGVGDNGDNCPSTVNQDQADADADGIGDACEAAGNSTPDDFTFADRTGVATGAYITSETRSITGIDVPVTVSVVNGQYRLNGGSWTSAAGQAVNGDTIAVRHVSSPDPGVTTATDVTVGTYSTPFRSTTTTIDRTPDAFGFATQTGVEPATTIESDIVTPAGYNTAVSVVAGPGAEYRINGGAWTSASGTLNPGDTLQTRHVSSSSSLTYTKTYVKAGGITGYFTTRTR